jgi:PilZ domain
MTANGGDHRSTETTGSDERMMSRRIRRAPIHGMLVAIDAPELSSDPWVVDGIDLSSSGMGLVLPPELLQGTRVLLSFRLGDHEISRLPATVQHKEGISGGVRFDDWPDSERLKLLEHLVSVYESPPK